MVEVVQPAEVYDIGDRVEVVVDFTDRFGEPADPTVIVIRVKKPDGTTVVGTFPEVPPDPGDPEIIRETLGTFYMGYEPTTHGRHDCRAEGTGALVAVVEGSFKVRRSRVI